MRLFGQVKAVIRDKLLIVRLEDGNEVHIPFEAKYPPTLHSVVEIKVH